MKYTGPKVKLSRKIGINMTPKARKFAGRKPYTPGQHGPNKRRSKMSDYGKQLLEKQRLKLQYNLSEKHMRLYYAKASRLVGNTGDLLVQLIESRLDSLVLRSNFARTIYAARQYVGHGHVLVNGKKVTIASYQVKPNDVIQIKEKSRNIEQLQEAWRGGVQPPPYIETNKGDFSAKYLYVPERDEVPVNCEIPLVVEYYSR